MIRDIVNFVKNYDFAGAILFEELEGERAGIYISYRIHRLIGDEEEAEHRYESLKEEINQRESVLRSQAGDEQ